MNQGQDDDSGRQDVSSPEASIEKSDPPAIDVKRGIRLLVSTTLVGVVFLVVFIYIALNH